MKTQCWLHWKFVCMSKMADKKKGKKRKEEISEELDKPSKEEYAIAKWMKKTVTTKKTKFLNHNVEYFTAAKAVDAFMASRWATEKEGMEPYFGTRLDVVRYLDKMLRHKFFHRAKKVPVSEQELKAKLKKKEKDKEKKGDAGEKRNKKADDERDDAESSHAEGEKKDDKPGGSGEEKEKKKRKIRLEMHLEQAFVDGLDAYVWIYDPIPVYYWFFGTLLVLGAIAICLFPLWPQSVRRGVYYLSVACAGFLVLIIGLAILRVVIFCIVWVLTMGKHYLWLFPNLTEDVGFLASFWPLYQYEYKGQTAQASKSKKKKKKEKDSDNEDQETQDQEVQNEEPQVEENQDQETGEQDSNKEKDAKLEVARPSEEVKDERRKKGTENSESESESSQNSQTGKDFEIVDREEVDS